MADGEYGDNEDGYKKDVRELNKLQENWRRMLEEKYK
jgi:hypothetical protein